MRFASLLAGLLLIATMFSQPANAIASCETIMNNLEDTIADNIQVPEQDDLERALDLSENCPDQSSLFQVLVAFAEALLEEAQQCEASGNTVVFCQFILDQAEDPDVPKGFSRECATASIEIVVQVCAWVSGGSQATDPAACEALWENFNSTEERCMQIKAWGGGSSTPGYIGEAVVTNHHGVPCAWDGNSQSSCDVHADDLMGVPYTEVPGKRCMTLSSTADAYMDLSLYSPVPMGHAEAQAFVTC
jgi:hypothetical protein